jgi:hypothetical protein
MVSKNIENVTGFVVIIFNMIEEIDNYNMVKIAIVLGTLWWRRNQSFIKID